MLCCLVFKTQGRFFPKQKGLLLVAVSTKSFGDKLVYENGGFPHLYGKFSTKPADGIVLSAKPILLDANDVHVVPI